MLVARSMRSLQDLRHGIRAFARNPALTAICVAFVSDDFFRLLAIDLQLGRGFRPEENETAGHGTVVVIGDALWRGSFGADAGVPAVMLPEMRDSGDAHRSDIIEARDARLFTLKGRLRSGVSLPEAQAELSTIGRDLARAPVRAREMALRRRAARVNPTEALRCE